MVTETTCKNNHPVRVEVTDDAERAVVAVASKGGGFVVATFCPKCGAELRGAERRPNGRVVLS